MKKLPKTVFVKREGAGEDEFLSISEDVEFLVEIGETAKIGEYILKQENDYKGIVQLS